MQEPGSIMVIYAMATKRVCKLSLYSGNKNNIYNIILQIMISKCESLNVTVTTIWKLVKTKQILHNSYNIILKTADLRVILVETGRENRIRRNFFPNIN